MSLANWEQTCELLGCSYAEASTLEDQLVGYFNQGVIFLLPGVIPNRYSTPELNERELCTVSYFPVFRS